MSKMNQNDSNSKVNVMSSYQDFGHYINPVSIESSQAKSEAYDSTFYNECNDFFSKNDVFQEEPSIYVSPLLTSSMTAPSLVLDGISTSHNLNDSPLFNNAFSASPSLKPALDLFPDLTDAASTRQYVIIPVDDTSSETTIPTSALNIPWSTEMTNFPTDILQNTSSTSPLLSTFTSDSPNPSFNVASTTTSSSMTSPIKSVTTHKGSICAVDKDPQLVTDELAVKRAKNTNAARKSRLRKMMRMNALEQQVTELNIKNNDLQTRIAVLKSQKKGLEEKNSEKDARMKMLEQQLAEAHKRLIKTGAQSLSFN